MSKGIQPRITGKLVLALFVAANTVYLIMVIYSIPMLMQHSGGIPIFDMSPLGYSYQDAMALLTALGEEGREVYVSLQLTLDIFYPILFALCYFSLFQWLIIVGRLSHRIWRYITVIPIFVCVLDYVENIFIWLMIRDYPTLSESLVTTSSTFTLAKSVSTMVYFIVLTLMIIFLIARRLTRLVTGK
ncbi:hypothetical protein [Thaumasiovibrio sp. DFM-14]|uniref:hypothetical protein n=1 Tax=Thaumasiovibrio sp. DFM-14 TaxID=3384792 RepID=UPI00399F68B9